MERESSQQTEQPRTSRKRKQGDRTASSSLSSADNTRKSRKVAVEYSTDETDEDKIPNMEEGMAFPRQMKTVKLTLPATPSPLSITLDISMASTAKQPCSRTMTKVTQTMSRLNSKGDERWSSGDT